MAELLGRHSKLKVKEAENDMWVECNQAVITTNIRIANIYFSKKNLRSILYNLISNALKYNIAEQPQIIISTKKENGYVLLSVKDNGIGIPESDFDKVFSMYGRLDKNTEGQGIGLYLVRKIVDASGGKVTVASEPGNGSTFTIYFKEEK
jgi:two-component system CheB/CheR fusion protein